MAQSFHCIAYEALDVCNAIEMATIEAAVARTGLAAPARALDIGCGNGAVAIRLAEAFGLDVVAVEMDPAMADLARGRAAASEASGQISVRTGTAAPVLAEGAQWNLISALGSTDPAGGGLREPSAIFAALAGHLRPGGWLLWGDLTWVGEPSAPLRQIVEITNAYADAEGWQAAARTAGLDVVSVEISDQALWDGYGAAMIGAVRDWLATNPDHLDAATIRTRTDQIAMMLDFGRGTMGFGLYLLRKPDRPVAD